MITPRKRSAVNGVILIVPLWAIFMSASLCAEETGKPNIAIINFSPINASSGEAVVVTSFIRANFVKNGQYAVVDAANMERILSAQKFQQTGCTNQECAVKMGKLLNVQWMVMGEYSVMGGARFLTASLVDVETGRIERTGSVQGFDVVNADRAAHQLVTQLIGEPIASGTYQRPVINTTAEIDPRIAGGRIGVGVNFPGAALRWFVVDRFAVEAKFQYEKTTMAGGPRMYLYIASLENLFPYIGIEGDYGKYKDEKVESVGYAAGAFVGGEVYLFRRLSLQCDFGPVYVSLKDRELSIQSGGMGFMVNFGLTFYISGGR